MSNQSDVWTASDQAAFSRVQDLFVDESYHNCLITACSLLSRAKDADEPRLYSVLAEFIRQCAAELAPKSQDQEQTPACSFCAKAPPMVRLGAGPDVFICNECVDLFSTVLNESHAH